MSEQRIFAGVTPASHNNDDGTPICVGTVFRSTVDTYVTAVYWYGTDVLPTNLLAGVYAALPVDAGKSPLAVATFGPLVSGQFNRGALAAPLHITAAVPYIAAVHADSGLTGGRYSATPFQFDVDNLSPDATLVGISSGSAEGVGLAGNGLFTESATLALVYPVSSFHNTWYGVDVATDTAPVTTDARRAALLPFLTP